MQEREKRILATLFPEEVFTCSLEEEGDPRWLHPEEASCVREAVPKRRREFAQGRFCARQALAHFGIRDFPLLMGKDRAPLWPRGIIGSLSHCAGYCAVAVARRGDLQGVGMDVELAEPLEQDLLSLICTDSEAERLAGSPAETRGVLAKLLFSVKESVFKCVYPQTGVFLDFHDCEVWLDSDRGAFSAHLTSSRLARSWRETRLLGRFASQGKRLFTGMVYPAGRSG
jgi:4'-phosphopantetheinyl transferase EntD